MLIRTLIISSIIAALTSLTSCSQIQSQLSGTALQTENFGEGQTSSTFPYHPLVYHLDLSILAYKLYAQTLVWPFDPYYEEANSKSGGRKKLMIKVHAWAEKKGIKQGISKSKNTGYRGPGALNGFEKNSNHTPIIYRYDKLYPWSQAITHSDGLWTEHVTPQKIKRQISKVYMCYRQRGRPLGAINIKQVTSLKSQEEQGAKDIILAFEGGTGNKRINGQPASQSLMGFVLLRHIVNSDRYDIHIVFRGSQSGSVKRAALEAFSNKEAKGNPDWITDLGYNRLHPNTGGAYISTKGAVHRGFAASMKSIFPQLFGCLKKAASLSPKRGPDNIFVTGHSLGGGLAQHFTSAVLLGSKYGPNGRGKAMPKNLVGWPWAQIKLITFSAPRAGDAKWANTLTTQALNSRFFTSALATIDYDALTANHQTILPRLLDINKPAGYRVLISTDPVTTEKVAGGKHVGQTIYADNASFFATAIASAHDPMKIRELLIQKLADPNMPKIIKKYSNTNILNPTRKKAKRGSPEEYEKIVRALKKYYKENNIKFDLTSFNDDYAVFKGILQGK